MNRGYEVRVNNQLMTRKLTQGKALKLVRKYQEEGKQASLAYKINDGESNSPKSIWAFLNEKRDYRHV